MNKTFLVLLLTLTAAVSALPAVAQKPIAKQSAKRNYVRRDFGFALNRPQDWDKINRIPEDSLAGFCRDTGAKYQPIIGIRTQRAYGPVVPPDLAQILDAQYKVAYKDYTLLGTARIKIAGKEAVSIAFSQQEPQTQALIRTRRIYLVHQGKLLLFEVASEIPDFDDCLPIFEKMMSSIQWLPAL